MWVYGFGIFVCNRHLLSHFFRSSEDSDCFEAAEEAQQPKKSSEFVESDFSQSIDNIDRILQNIDEEQEAPAVAARVRSRGSESSGDVTGASVSSEPGDGRPRLLKASIRSTPFTSARVMKDWAVSTDEHLDRRTVAPAHSGSWFHSEANSRKPPPTLEKGYGACRSTGCIPSAQKEPTVEALAGRPSTEERLDSAGSETSSTAEDTVVDTGEKKKRLKSALIKRARSVAVFSLKLKERRAKAESKELEKAKERGSPKNDANITVGGELSCVPIEMLISLDDVKTPKRGAPGAASKANTPTGFGYR